MPTRFIILAKEKITNLSAQELKKKNMAWVPKKINQNKNDVHASIATSTIKVKKEKDGSNKQAEGIHHNIKIFG